MKKIKNVGPTMAFFHYADTLRRKNFSVSSELGIYVINLTKLFCWVRDGVNPLRKFFSCYEKMLIFSEPKPCQKRLFFIF